MFIMFIWGGISFPRDEYNPTGLQTCSASLNRKGLIIYVPTQIAEAGPTPKKYVSSEKCGVARLDGKLHLQAERRRGKRPQLDPQTIDLAWGNIYIYNYIYNYIYSVLCIYKQRNNKPFNCLFKLGNHPT